MVITENDFCFFVQRHTTVSAITVRLFPGNHHNSCFIHTAQSLFFKEYFILFVCFLTRITRNVNVGNAPFRNFLRH